MALGWFSNFMIYFVIAIMFALINSALFFISGKIIKIKEGTFLKALACGIYTGLAGMVLAYFNMLILTVFFAVLTLFVINFIYELSFKDKILYLMWLAWVVLILLFSLVVVGIGRIIF
ncbi:MAG: hypothetical protein Q8O89_02375 [Nanoarchaeota archaeon]|nr:hypothetical protein [Nanoarchaeota archaeon]